MDPYIKNTFYFNLRPLPYRDPNSTKFNEIPRSSEGSRGAFNLRYYQVEKDTRSLGEPARAWKAQRIRRCMDLTFLFTWYLSLKNGARTTLLQRLEHTLTLRTVERSAHQLQSMSLQPYHEKTLGKTKTLHVRFMVSFTKELNTTLGTEIQTSWNRSTIRMEVH